MQINGKFIVNNYFQGKSGHLTLVDMDNGGIFKMLIPGEGEFKPGQQITAENVQIKAVMTEKYGLSLFYQNGSFKKS